MDGLAGAPQETISLRCYMKVGASHLSVKVHDKTLLHFTGTSSQLYMRLQADLREEVDRLGRGLVKVRGWMGVNTLNLNLDKMDTIGGTEFDSGKVLYIDTPSEISW